MRLPPYIGPQKQRWVDFGFDLEAAARRHAAFRAKFASVGNHKDAVAAIMGYADQELRAASAQGVPVDDPDLWRIDSMRKHIEWSM